MKINTVARTKLGVYTIFLNASYINISTALPSSTRILSTKKLFITAEMTIGSLPLSSIISASKSEKLICQSPRRVFFEVVSIVLILLRWALLLFLEVAQSSVEPTIVCMTPKIGHLPSDLFPLSWVLLRPSLWSSPINSFRRPLLIRNSILSLSLVHSLVVCPWFWWKAQYLDESVFAPGWMGRCLLTYGSWVIALKICSSSVFNGVYDLNLW